ncbi:MAG: PAS domain-containing protein [Rhodospirillales bacterium]|nr:PAS domain-containing protein [Rhodospirillales bacterium]
MTAARLERMWNLSPVIMYIRGPTGKKPTTYVSENVTAHLGHEPRDIMDGPSFWSDHIHPDDKAGILSNLKSLTKTGHCVHEYRIRHKDGAYRWVRDQLTLDRDGLGKPRQIIGHMFDVTEHKRVEDALRERETRLNAVINNLPVLVYLRDKEGRYILTNKEFDRRHGIEPGSAVGKTPDALVSKKAADGFLATDRKVLRSGAVISRESELTYHDGVTRTVLTNKFPVSGRDGKPVAVGVVSTDISERKRVEDALRQSEAHLRAIVEHSPSNIYIRDTQGRYLLAGKELCRLLGTTPDEIKGRTPSDFYPPDVAEEFLARDREVMKIGRPVVTEAAKTYPSGETRTVISTKFPLFQTDNAPMGVCNIAIDISERKRAEGALRRSEAQLMAIVDNSPNYIYIRNTDGRYLLAGKEICRLLGTTQDEIKGKSPSDFYPPDVADTFLAEDRKVIATGRPVTTERDITYPTGETRTVISMKFPLFEAEGDLSAYAPLSPTSAIASAWKWRSGKARRDSRPLLITRRRPYPSKTMKAVTC